MGKHLLLLTSAEEVSCHMGSSSDRTWIVQWINVLTLADAAADSPLPSHRRRSLRIGRDCGVTVFCRESARSSGQGCVGGAAAYVKSPEAPRFQREWLVAPFR